MLLLFFFFVCFVTPAFPLLCPVVCLSVCLSAFVHRCHFLSAIVGAVVQHILGVTVTHQDMEAIDPDYYKNLLQITTLPLEDLGLDLTFSADTEMFGACVEVLRPFPPLSVKCQCPSMPPPSRV